MSETPPVIWQVTAGRADAWREIRLEALRLAPDAFDPTFAEWSDRPLADFAARLDAIETWAAGDRQGLPLAVAGWQPGWTPGTEDTGWITAVYTRPAARGRGLMSALLRQIADRAAAAGMVRLGLHVGLANTAARAVYRRAGFTETGAPFVNDRGIAEIEMHRPSLEPPAPSR